MNLANLHCLNIAEIACTYAEISALDEMHAPILKLIEPVPKLNALLLK